MNSLYKSVLGESFHHLSPLLQRFHTGQDDVWRGEARVDWSKYRLIRLLLKLGALPQETERVLVTICVTAKQGSELWQRNFGEKLMLSRQQSLGAALRESFGLVSLELHNQIQDGSLHQACSRSSFCGIPLPHALGFRVTAREWQVGDQFHFDVQIGVASLSLLRYRGWLCPQSSRA